MLSFTAVVFILSMICTYMCLPSFEYRRGPHTFWLKKAERGETIDTNSDGLVNMLHYEDAAAATIAAVLAGRHQYCILLPTCPC